jgi:hypothetical protein
MESLRVPAGIAWVVAFVAFFFLGFDHMAFIFGSIFALMVGYSYSDREKKAV